MSTERFKITPAVFLFLLRNDEVLLHRRCNTGYGDGWYDVPSGHVEEGELPSETMVREAREETGIEVAIKNLSICGADYTIYDDATYVHVYFTTTIWLGEPTICEPEKCDDMKWFSIHDLPENILPHIKITIEKIRAKQLIFFYEKIADKV